MASGGELAHERAKPRELELIEETRETFLPRMLLDMVAGLIDRPP